MERGPRPDEERPVKAAPEDAWALFSATDSSGLPWRLLLFAGSAGAVLEQPEGDGQLEWNDHRLQACGQLHQHARRTMELHGEEHGPREAGEGEARDEDEVEDTHAVQPALPRLAARLNCDAVKHLQGQEGGDAAQGVDLPEADDGQRRPGVPSRKADVPRRLAPLGADRHGLLPRVRVAVVAADSACVRPPRAACPPLTRALYHRHRRQDKAQQLRDDEQH
mmetsp:Transcript_32588/g.83240  ORF Transcript_32588/g.83240 Transcript_32588/m.83240 type:complete len:222 (+) Transcript_32588:1447-2112(+)